ncbi:MAG: hypothetical protein AAF416_23290 [Pseudomonadota bacterium]
MEMLYLVVMTTIVLFSFWKILPRAGLSPWLTLTTLIPFVGLPVLLLVLALRPWPGDGGTA